MKHRIIQWDRTDRIEGDKIILVDSGNPERKVLKKVEIITPGGSKKFYEIKRTSKGGYLFN
jgi:hypothetical protein